MIATAAQRHAGECVFFLFRGIDADYIDSAVFVNGGGNAAVHDALSFDLCAHERTIKMFRRAVHVT